MTIRLNQPVTATSDLDFDADTGLYVTKVVIRIPTFGPEVQFYRDGLSIIRAGYFSLGEDVFITGYYELSRYYHSVRWFDYQEFIWTPSANRDAGDFDLGVRADGIRFWLTTGTVIHAYVEGF